MISGTQTDPVIQDDPTANPGRNIAPLGMPLQILSGTRVSWKGENYQIRCPLNLDEVLLETKGSRPVVAPIHELAPIVGEENGGGNKVKMGRDQELQLLDDHDWRAANARFAVVQEILTSSLPREEAVQLVCAKHAISRATIYRHLDRYTVTQRISSLVPTRPGVPKGVKRLDTKCETIITDYVPLYLSSQKLSPTKIIQLINTECRKQGITPPHPNTIRNRIHSLPQRLVQKSRFGPNAANAYEIQEGEFTMGTHPRAVVQVDHTLLDIMIVDSVERRSIGRAWITLIIDTYSRVVVGFFISLEHPSALSVGLALVSAILPKEEWLSERGVTKVNWPIWGELPVIHADNAKEFGSRALKRACIEHHMEIIWRPLKTPRYGAHIERLLGTLSNQIHALPGTTFSDPKLRENYDSEAKASYTLEELEAWLIEQIGVYHHQIHRTLRRPPIKVYEEGIFGNAKRAGTGIPDRCTEPERLKIDFLPYELRTVQVYGIKLYHIDYCADVLRSKVKIKKNGKPVQYLFHYDPRDLSEIYYFDEKSKGYIAIPYRHRGRPPISI